VRRPSRVSCKRGAWGLLRYTHQALWTFHYPGSWVSLLSWLVLHLLCETSLGFFFPINLFVNYFRGKVFTGPLVYSYFNHISSLCALLQWISKLYLAGSLCWVSHVPSLGYSFSKIGLKVGFVPFVYLVLLGWASDLVDHHFYWRRTFLQNYNWFVGLLRKYSNSRLNRFSLWLVRINEREQSRRWVLVPPLPPWVFRVQFVENLWFSGHDPLFQYFGSF
jgi:hypothetical protein